MSIILTEMMKYHFEFIHTLSYDEEREKKANVLVIDDGI